MPLGQSTTTRPGHYREPRFPRPATALAKYGRGRRWNPPPAGAPCRRGCAPCRRRARRSDRSSTALRHCERASANHRLLLLLLLLLLRLLFHVRLRLRLSLLLELLLRLFVTVRIAVGRRFGQLFHRLGGTELAVGPRRARRQYPGVLGPAALAGVDHPRSFDQRHPGQAAGQHPHVVTVVDRERPQG